MPSPDLIKIDATSAFVWAEAVLAVHQQQQQQQQTKPVDEHITSSSQHQIAWWTGQEEI